MSDNSKTGFGNRWNAAKKSNASEEEHRSLSPSETKQEPIINAVIAAESVTTKEAESAIEEEEESKGESNFADFPQITENTIKGLNDRGITDLFPIQTKWFKAIYEDKDIIGRDLTGSGKTLAFCLPLVEKYRKLGLFGGAKKLVIKRKLYSVILAPTRELALQVAKELKALRHSEFEYRVITVYGGVSIEEQIREFRSGVEFFVGTTGRVLDHIERGNIDFSEVKAVVLDEADQMLNMGFQEDVEKIMDAITKEVKEKPQFWLFSATVPPWVKNVAKNYLNTEYVYVDLTKDLKNKTSQTVQHLAINWPYYNRTGTLLDVLTCYGGIHGKTIVFTQTKADANSIVLADKMSQNVEVLHGDIAQNQREVTLKRFREGKVNVLVATDVASRGLDIQDVDLVIQLEPPKDAETYIHRSGRTARAGKSGTCITFYNKKQQSMINFIEMKAGIKLKKVGAPQPKDIIKASVKDAIRCFDKVDDSVLSLFKDTADELIESKGAAKALWLALAYISGTTEKLKNKSLLTGQENFVTIDFQTTEEFRGTSFVWKILKRIMSQSLFETVRDMRLYTNRKGAVFDIPEEHSETIIELYENDKNSKKYINYEIKLAEELPDLFDLDTAPSSGEFRTKTRGGYGGGRGGYGTARDGGYGGRDGGYGGRDGGYSARDTQDHGDDDDAGSGSGAFFRNSNKPSQNDGFSRGGYGNNGSRNGKFSESASYRGNNRGGYSGYSSHEVGSTSSHGYGPGTTRNMRGKKHHGRFKDQY